MGEWAGRPREPSLVANTHSRPAGTPLQHPASSRRPWAVQPRSTAACHSRSLPAALRGSQTPPRPLPPAPAQCRPSASAPPAGTARTAARHSGQQRSCCHQRTCCGTHKCGGTHRTARTQTGNFSSQLTALAALQKTPRIPPAATARRAHHCTGAHHRLLLATLHHHPEVLLVGV
jgi:hypothetical protein